MSAVHNSVMVRLKGGLGNQLFQYATARSLALDSERKLVVDRGWFERKQRPRSYRLNEFVANPSTVSYSKVKLHQLTLASVTSSFTSATKILREPKQLQYRPFKLPLTSAVLLEGYWQSPKYFEKHRNDLLNAFKPAGHIDQSSLTTPEANTVAVHIRRGDYITEHNAHIVSPKYVRNAMSEFGNNANFLFFSDDLSWCQDNFGGDNVGFSSQPSDLMDLIQMSRCDHNIIANSSFSWWSAWLNENKQQRVIAPTPWAEGGNTHADILPAHWETLAI